MGSEMCIRDRPTTTSKINEMKSISAVTDLISTLLDVYSISYVESPVLTEIESANAAGTSANIAKAAIANAVFWNKPR